MPDRDAMIAAVQTHCRASTEGDLDAWVKIWADQAVVEDPVGSPPHRGIEALRTTFWAMSRNAAPRLTLSEEVIVCGNEAIAIMTAEVGPPDNRRTLSPVVDHFTFDDDARIVGMRAFFNY
ncbi:MAG: nuclear transport factor 2 family protein [Sphingomonadales bacterium]|nr:nuclear transport factor 2 family protein [Sphingomonadales bacterium]